MQSILAFFRSLFRKLKNLFTGKGWTDDTTVADDDDGIEEAVGYYGCPNSKKAKALQLEKKLRG